MQLPLIGVCGRYMATSTSGWSGATSCFLCCRYQRVARCCGHSSCIRHIDWAANSKVLQSSCGAYELLYFDANTGKQVCHHWPSSAASVADPSPVQDAVCACSILYQRQDIAMLNQDVSELCCTCLHSNILVSSLVCQADALRPCIS